MTLPAPLCGHSASLTFEGADRAACGICSSYWDARYAGQEFQYDESYPEGRRHFDEEIGRLKVETLSRWLGALGLDPAGQVVCEVGYGGGHCLRYLSGKAGTVYGIEASSAHRSHAASIGLSQERLFTFGSLPELLPSRVGLWLFLDSFEHLPEPDTFLDWVGRNSADRAEVVLVAPEAGSRSDRVLGRLWPHRLPDHRFHWSRAGLREIFSRHGFSVRREFSPRKLVSARMIVAHALHFLGIEAKGGTLGWVPKAKLDFNIGEMGLLLHRDEKPSSS